MRLTEFELCQIPTTQVNAAPGDSPIQPVSGVGVGVGVGVGLHSRKMRS